MPQDQKKATLRDIINYEPEQLLSKEELTLIKNTFKGNKELFKILRKVFIPTMSDPDLPIEQMADDVYMTGVDWAQMTAENVKAILQGRQEAIKFICGGFIKLKMLANMSEESPYAEALRKKKDSAR